MAKLIKSNGEVVLNVDISSLKKLQKFVEGYIEIIYLKDSKCMVVNEEGLLHNLPINHKASKIYGHILLGNVVECGLAELN
jgi:hypothetical protein